MHAYLVAFVPLLGLRLFCPTKVSMQYTNMVQTSRTVHIGQSTISSHLASSWLLFLLALYPWLAHCKQWLVQKPDGQLCNNAPTWHIADSKRCFAASDTNSWFVFFSFFILLPRIRYFPMIFSGVSLHKSGGCGLLHKEWNIETCRSPKINKGWSS